MTRYDECSRTTQPRTITGLAARRVLDACLIAALGCATETSSTEQGSTGAELDDSSDAGDAQTDADATSAGSDGDSVSPEDGSTSGTAGTDDSSGDDSNGGATGPLGLNDITVLFPATPQIANDLLSATDQGDKGVLLPEAVFDALDMDEHVYGQLRVVAVRLDPCAPIDAEATTCEPELRLVFGQLLGLDAGFEDSGVHTTYALTETEFDAVIETITALRAGHGGPDLDAPLGIHPTMADEDGDGPFTEAYQDLILQYAGGTNLVRTTFMEFGSPFDFGFPARTWRFGAVEVADGSPTPMMIPPAESVEFQDVAAELGAEASPLAIEPILEGEEPISVTLGQQTLAAAAMDDVEAALEATFELEDPELHNLHSTSCVGCHITTQARVAIGSERGIDVSSHPAQFTSEYDLSLENSTSIQPDLDRFQPMRAFGYNGWDVVFTQRVVNETAAALELLSSLDD